MMIWAVLGMVETVGSLGGWRCGDLGCKVEDNNAA